MSLIVLRNDEQQQCLTACDMTALTQKLGGNNRLQPTSLNMPASMPSKNTKEKASVLQALSMSLAHACDSELPLTYTEQKALHECKQPLNAYNSRIVKIARLAGKAILLGSSHLDSRGIKV